MTRSPKMQPAWRNRLDGLLTPRAILVIAGLGFLVCSFPGMIPTEAADDLVNARIGDLTDWNSPVFAEVWRWLGWVVSGPAPMLLAQTTLWLLGSYHLLARALSPRAAAIAAGAVLWFPPIAATAAVTCADSLLAGCLIAGAAALGSPRRAVVGGGLVLLVLASGMREGAAIAALPIVVLGLPRPRVAGLRRFAIALAVWLVVAGAGAGLRAVLVDTPSGRRELALASHDISGTLRFGKPDAATLGRQLHGVRLVTTQALAAEVRHWYAHPEQLMSGDHRLFDAPTSPDGVELVVAGRNRIMHAQLGAYLRYRLHVFVRVLELSGRKGRSPLLDQFTETPELRYNLVHAAHRSGIQQATVAVTHALDKTPVFRPYVYLALGLLALGFAIWRRERDAVMLLASAVGYALALMFVAITPEHRASHWMIGAVVVASVRVASREYLGRSAG